MMSVCVGCPDVHEELILQLLNSLFAIVGLDVREVVRERKVFKVVSVESDGKQFVCAIYGSVGLTLLEGDSIGEVFEEVFEESMVKFYLYLELHDIFFEVHDRQSHVGLLVGGGVGEECRHGLLGGSVN